MFIYKYVCTYVYIHSVYVLEIKLKAAQRSFRTTDLQLLLRLHKQFENGSRLLLGILFYVFYTYFISSVTFFNHHL